MDFSLPGQLRGPECRHVISQAIRFRRLLEPWFHALSVDRVAKLTIILRVDSSLGSFGPEGVENVQLANKKLTCELVLEDQGWEELSERQIIEILRQRISMAIHACFQQFDVLYERDELDELVASIT